MTDLFGGPDQVQTYRVGAYAATPGTGPKDKTRKDCSHRYRMSGGSRYYNKCDLVKATHGSGTDIKVSSPACTRFKGIKK